MLNVSYLLFSTAYFYQNSAFSFFKKDTYGINKKK